MRIIKTQRILYNHEFRIRFLADFDDEEFIRLVRKLPDSKWSICLNSWHTNNIPDHINYLNTIFPASYRFFDISGAQLIPKFEEVMPERRIQISHNYPDNSLNLKFMYDNELSSLIRDLGGKTKCNNKKDWTISNSPGVAENLNSYLRKANYRIDISGKKENLAEIGKLVPDFGESLDRFSKILQSLNYKERTINQYRYHTRRYLLHVGVIDAINPEDVNDYINEMSISRNYSRSYQNQVLNSVFAYSRYILGQNIKSMIIPRPKRKKTQPEILSSHEIEKIIKLIPNIKHNAIISTIYLTGITVGETISIKPEDVDAGKMQVLIRGRNDKPERIIPICNDLIQKIEVYMNFYQPKNFLFEGYSGRQYTERSIQKVLKKYVQKAGIKKKTSAQTLRHSFAVRLVESGADMISVQHQLGHRSSRTTENYAFATPSYENKY